MYLNVCMYVFEKESNFKGGITNNLNLGLV